MAYKPGWNALSLAYSMPQVQLVWLSQTSARSPTFARRKTTITDGLPTGLTGEFGDDQTKQAQWRGFLRRSGLTTAALELGEVVSVIGGFLARPLAMARRREAVTMRWPAGGPWIAIIEPTP